MISDCEHILSEKQKILAEHFRVRICSLTKELDPNNQEDWFSLSLGFFLALGLEIYDSRYLANHVRYCKEYWEH